MSYTPIEAREGVAADRARCEQSEPSARNDRPRINPDYGEGELISCWVSAEL